MLYARHPTEGELQEPKRMTRQEVRRVSQPARMVLLSARRKTVPEIANILAACCPTLRFWIKRFNAEGPIGLYDRARSGQALEATDQVKDAIVQMIQGDPSREEYLATCWTVAMLVLAVVRKMGVRLSPSTLRATLHELGLRWGRPRLAMPDKVDPEKASKLWAMVGAVWDAGQGAPILCIDESRVHLLPLLRSIWHWVGEQVRVPTPGNNQSRAIFGALNIRTGQWDYLFRKRMRKEAFIALLEYLLAVYTTGPIVLIVDNYSSHTAHAVQAWLNEHPRMRLVYLPKYCSHLNPIEPIWLQLKNAVAPNRLCDSMKTLLHPAKAFLDNMRPEQALVWAAA